MTVSSCCACGAQVMDPNLTVNDIIRQWPSTLPALNALGIDTCCGGGERLADAAQQAGVPIDSVVAAISVSCGPKGDESGETRCAGETR